jgi:TolB protein
MKKKFIVFLLFSFYLSTALSAADIEANVRRENPTLKLVSSGISNELQKGLIHNLNTCGWFKLSQAATANYTLNVQGTPQGKFNINILDTAGNLIPKGKYTHDLSTLKAPWMQHRLIDEVISRVYNPQNKICASRIAFCGSRRGIKEIYTIDFSGGKLNKETNYQTITVEPSWAPNNRSLSYTVYGRQNANLIQKDMTTRKHRLMSHFRGLNSSAAFHPQGKKFILTLGKDNNVDLFIMSLGDTKNTLALTRDSNIESSPTWSPDGNKICYVSASMRSNGKVNSPRLYMMDLVAKRAWPLYRDGIERVSPDWSRASGILVYSKRKGRQYVLTICDPTNPKQEKVIVSDAGNWEAPSWAPDGRHIVCTRNIGGRTDLYIIDTLLGTKRQIKLLQKGKPYFDNLTLPAWSSIY